MLGGRAKHFLVELASRRLAVRIPEPDLVMTDPERVRAFDDAGRDSGAMSPMYLFHAANVSQVLRPGDVCLELGCGPGNQLTLLARLNPDVQFVGVDLSSEMLERARRRIDDLGLRNARVMPSDMSRLDEIADASVDAVYSSMTIHHLPDERALNATFRSIARVSKREAGLYLADFGHLKTERTIEYLANEYLEREAPFFVEDYRNSLRAAFELRAWDEALRANLAGRATLHSTCLVPYLVAVMSRARRALPGALTHSLRAHFGRLSNECRADVRQLAMLFRLGGTRMPAEAALR